MVPDGNDRGVDGTTGLTSQHLVQVDARGGPVPPVSVITIFLNADRFMREAIESILAQDFTNFELILVDDGSTDGSTHLARQYTNKFPKKILYLEHEKHVNKGMSASRNLGIQHARGAFITFCDADDVWMPGKLTEQLKIFQITSRTGHGVWSCNLLAIMDGRQGSESAWLGMFKTLCYSRPRYASRCIR